VLRPTLLRIVDSSFPAAVLPRHICPENFGFEVCSGKRCGNIQSTSPPYKTAVINGTYNMFFGIFETNKADSAALAIVPSPYLKRQKPTPTCLRFGVDLPPIGFCIDMIFGAK
jgi:hypothetical protein